MKSRTKIAVEAMKIFGSSGEETMALRTAWMNMAKNRIEFLESLRKMGLKGKDYSKAVIKYDKQYMNVF